MNTVGVGALFIVNQEVDALKQRGVAAPPGCCQRPQRSSARRVDADRLPERNHKLVAVALANALHRDETGQFVVDIVSGGVKKPGKMAKPFSSNTNKLVWSASDSAQNFGLAVRCLGRGGPDGRQASRPVGEQNCGC